MLAALPERMRPQKRTLRQMVNISANCSKDQQNCALFIEWGT